jgi:hypothetical protein
VLILHVPSSVRAPCRTWSHRVACGTIMRGEAGPGLMAGAVLPAAGSSSGSGTCRFVLQRSRAGPFGLLGPERGSPRVAARERA